MRIFLLPALLLAPLSACGDAPDNATNGIEVTGQSSAGTTLQPAPAETRGQDFVSTVIGSLDFSMQSAAMAAQKGGAPNVKQFATRMRGDFTASRAELEQIAGSSGLKLDPIAGDTHQTDLAVLSSTSGNPLDRAFAEQQMESLTLLLGLVRAYKNGGDNPALKAWAEKHQGVINDRLLDVQTVKAELEEAAE